MFGVEKFNELKKFLNENAVDLGEDNKDVYFFIMENKLLKVVDNQSADTAEIVLKMNKIGSGSNFLEKTILIDRNEVDTYANFFKDLGVTDNIMHSYQERHNYQYNGVTLSLKYSEHWQHHLELEVEVDDLNKKRDAEKQIFGVAKELSISIMSDEELKKFTSEKERENASKN